MSKSTEGIVVLYTLTFFGTHGILKGSNFKLNRIAYNTRIFVFKT